MACFSLEYDEESMEGRNSKSKKRKRVKGRRSGAGQGREKDRGEIMPVVG